MMGLTKKIQKEKEIRNNLLSQYDYIYGHTPTKHVKRILYDENRRDKLIRRKYKIRNLNGILAYQTLLEEYNPNGNTQNKNLKKLLVQCGVIPKKDINSQPSKDNSDKANRIRAHYNKMGTSQEESDAMALVDIVYNSEKEQARCPLALHHRDNPVTQQIMALHAGDGYNYRGAKQYLLHRVIKNKNTIGNDKYGHYFKYFHENPSTYVDTYPSKLRYKKYLQEALMSGHPKRYQALGVSSFHLQKIFGLSQEESLAYIHKKLRHKFVSHPLKETIKEFQNNRANEINNKGKSKQNTHQKNKQKDGKGPEM